MHNGLVRFRMRRHHPITLSPTSFYTVPSSSIAFPKQNKHGRSLIQWIQCCIGIDQPSPPLLCRWAQIALSVYNLQSMVTNQRHFSGYVFDMVLYPLVTSNSFFSRCRCELRNRISGATGEVRRVHRGCEVCEGQCRRQTG